MFVDLSFKLAATCQILADHGYLLYSAVSRLLPEAHNTDVFGIHPIRGRQLGGRTLQLTDYSRLVIRTGADHIARFLPLAGKQLRILDRSLCIGVPDVHALVPAPALRSRLVTIKLPGVAAQSAEAAAEVFRSSALRKLAELGIHASSPLPPGEGQGVRAAKGEGGETPCSVLPAPCLTLNKRRTLRIKDKEVVGYEVLVESLTAAESIALQEAGLGGRRRMGCGIFVPMREEKESP